MASNTTTVRIKLLDGKQVEEFTEILRRIAKAHPDTASDLKRLAQLAFNAKQVEDESR